MKEALNVLIFLGESSLLSVSVLCLVKVKRVTGNFHRKVFFFKKLPSRGWRGERTKGSSRVQWAEQVSNGSPLVRSVFGLNYWHLCQVAGGGDPPKKYSPLSRISAATGPISVATAARGAWIIYRVVPWTLAICGIYAIRSDFCLILSRPHWRFAVSWNFRKTKQIKGKL